MRGALKALALGISGLVILVVVVGFFLPRTWSVSQSIEVRAEPGMVHPFVEDFHQWPLWAGWNNDMDPSLRYWYEGAKRGVGAIQRWQGDRTGRGTLRIVRSDPARGVWLEESIESEVVNAHGSVEYSPAGDGSTTVTWNDHGELPPIIGGYFRWYMEASLGEHFATGLQKLKMLVEEKVREVAEPGLVAGEDTSDSDGPRNPIE